MSNGRVFEIGAKREAERGGKKSLSSRLPAVPVLPATLLMMELSAQEDPVDLRQLSQAVLSDPGAALQILRKSGSEYSSSEARPARIEECISALGVQACLDVASRRPLSRGMDKQAILQLWEHSRDIAVYCRRVAEAEFEDVNSDEAHLIGLLHDLGAVPTILNWRPVIAAWGNPATAALRLAEKWLLPESVVAYFAERECRDEAGKWTAIVQRAHDCAGVPLEDKSGAKVISFGRS